MDADIFGAWPRRLADLEAPSIPLSWPGGKAAIALVYLSYCKAGKPRTGWAIVLHMGRTVNGKKGVEGPVGDSRSL